MRVSTLSNLPQSIVITLLFDPLHQSCQYFLHTQVLTLFGLVKQSLLLTLGNLRLVEVQNIRLVIQLHHLLNVKRTRRRNYQN